MAAEHVVGITAEVLVVVTGIPPATAPGTVNVRVIDNNGAFLTAAVNLPDTLVHVVGIPIAVNDVLEKIDDGRTAVVRFVSTTDPSQWSPAATGTPLVSSLGWRKVGTATIT